MIHEKGMKNLYKYIGDNIINGIVLGPSDQSLLQDANSYKDDANIKELYQALKKLH